MRVIQDSDDEFDDDLEADVPPPKRPDAPEQDLINETSQSGTGSTESLKRAIQKAHRAHLQSQPSQNEPQSSVSLPEHPTKRRKTSVGVTHRRSPEVASPKRRGPVTYGKTSKYAFSSPFAGQVGEQMSNEAAGKVLAPSCEAIWNLEGSMRDNYALHDPMAMFPEPSSTVPNATLTQQRVMECVAAPAMLGTDLEAEAPRYHPPPEPSVPWSDLMKFSPANTGEQAESSNQGQPISDMPLATPLEYPPEDQNVSGSQRSRRGSSVRSTDIYSKNETFRDDVNSKGTMAPPIEVSPLSGLQTLQTASSNSHQRTQEKSRESPCRRKSPATLIPSSDDDLTAIGLPREQYKPRPSRSRSLRVDTEHPIDYSVRPEKAQKASKRRKTLAATVDVSTVTTPQKIQQICDMGFTPSTTGRALKQNSGDVTRTVDWLVSNNIDEDELAPHDTPKRKTAPKEINTHLTMDYEAAHRITHGQSEERRHAAEILLKSIEAQATVSAPALPRPANNDRNSSIVDMPSTAADIKSPKVQVVIPTRSPNAVTKEASVSRETLDKKPKRRKTTLDLPKSEPVLEERIATKATPEKKRGRGRPKKATNIAPSTETVPEVSVDTTQIDQHSEVLQSIEANFAPCQSKSTEVQTGIEANVAQMHESEGFPGVAAASLALPKKTPPATASRTPEISTITSSHSPMNKGKVPHRVGLSKRARIAPLLRTLKK